MSWIESVSGGSGDFPISELKGHTVRCNVSKPSAHTVEGYFDGQLIVQQIGIPIDNTWSGTLKTEGDTSSLTNGSYTLEVGKYRPSSDGPYFFAQVKLNDKVICESPAFNRYNGGDTGTFTIT